jgi:hypothetical protein
MSRAQGLADQFRSGNLMAVAAEVACDGPTALAVAALLDTGELERLRRALDAHLDSPVAALVLGGEARGGPVMVTTGPTGPVGRTVR